MTHTCNLCSYSTKDKSNYNRHIASSSHKNKVIINEEKSDKNKITQF